jgi:hypothetical protein
VIVIAVRSGVGIANNLYALWHSCGVYCRSGEFHVGVERTPEGQGTVPQTQNANLNAVGELTLPQVCEISPFSLLAPASSQMLGFKRWKTRALAPITVGIKADHRSYRRGRYVGVAISVCRTTAGKKLTFSGVRRAPRGLHLRVLR